MISLTNCRSTFFIKLGNFVRFELQRDLKPHKNIIPTPSSSDWIIFWICMHWETSKGEQAVLTHLSPVPSVGIRDNNIIYINPTMIIYEGRKPAEHALLHPICVLSHLMCACKHCNVKLSLYYWGHWSCWWIYQFKKLDLTRFFIIKPRHPGRLKKQNWVEKPRTGLETLATCVKTPTVASWSERFVSAIGWRHM